jgi:prepilin-type N-terminal cleavage/methylation domain-containing protein
MKNYSSVEGRGAGVGRQMDAASRVTRHLSAFTLVELLVVISIIAVLAAMILPVAGAVKRQAFIRSTQTQMAQLETALDRYKSAYGFYPPDSVDTINNTPISQLYYELVGTTNNGVAYVTLDGGASISTALVPTAFGVKVGGFINCDKLNPDESAPRAQEFLPDLKPNQYFQYITNNNVQVTLLVAPAGGPDPTYQPLGITDVNPWRYNSSSPTNNPGSYDLWIQLQISGKKYLICNWTKQVQINNPLP